MISKQEYLQEIMRTTIKKPSPRSTEPYPLLASQKEIEDRLRKAKILEDLGISISNFSEDDEYEDADVLKAIMLVNQGKEIPEELKKRLNQKKQHEVAKDNRKMAMMDTR